jgi:hypothetical protein
LRADKHTTAVFMANARAFLRTKSSKGQTIITCDQCFADGTVIEFVSGSADQPNLLLYSDGREVISGPRVEYRDCLYEAPHFHPSLLQATRLPKKAVDYGSLPELVTNIADQFRELQNFTEREAQLLAAFSVSTWVSDRLSFAPSLTIFGPGEALNVLPMLSCFCRRPLTLGDLTPTGLQRLPADLHFSLLINQANMTNAMRRLLGASGYRGLHILGSRGTVVELFCSRAIFCAMEFDNVLDDAIHVFVDPGQILHAIDVRRQCAIAEQFQPKLLSYRLQNLTKIQLLEVEVPNFAAPTRQLAMSLGSCFRQDPELADVIYSLLAPQDKEWRDTRAASIEQSVLEILFQLLHKRNLKRIPVNKIADYANTLQRSRGEIREYTAAEIGWKLKTMGIHRHRTSSGSVINLDSETSAQVHRLARPYGLVAKMPDAERCRECSAAEAHA